MTLSVPDVPRAGSMVLRSWVDAGTLQDFLDRIFDWSSRRESRYVCLVNVHSLVTAKRNPSMGLALEGSDANLPDGWPVAWALRRLAWNRQQRVSGPELMWAMLEQAASRGVGVYLYGGHPDALRRLEARIAAELPLLHLCGTWSPPFRPLTPAEAQEAAARINASGAGIALIGLGCPKQELWMAEHRGRIHAVMIGVGAAFDFHSGRVRRAPEWMRRNGLEWAHRLAQEPRRLAGRYLDTNAAFLRWVLGAVLTGGLRRSPEAQRRPASADRS